MKNELAKYYGGLAFEAGQAPAPMADAAFAGLAATLDAAEVAPAAYAFKEGFSQAKVAAQFRKQNAA